jgi:hypothetical protein
MPAEVVEQPGGNGTLAVDHGTRPTIAQAGAPAVSAARFAIRLRTVAYAAPHPTLRGKLLTLPFRRVTLAECPGGQKCLRVTGTWACERKPVAQVVPVEVLRRHLEEYHAVVDREPARGYNGGIRGIQALLKGVEAEARTLPRDTSTAGNRVGQTRSLPRR